MPKRRMPDSPRLRRGGVKREARLRVTIFTEGKVTEPTYFERFAEEHGNALVEIKCIGGAGTPATLVEKATGELKVIKRSRNSYERNDQVWVIFDEDEHPYVKQSIQQAEDKGIAVGYSNPCFEVWLLIHHKDFDAPDDRHQVQRKLADCDNGYDPNGAKRPTFAALSAGYDNAVARAKAMRGRRVNEGQPKGRPYTNVDLLTAVIVDNGKPPKPR